MNDAMHVLALRTRTAQRAPPADAATLRRRLTQALEMADLWPAGMPPAAVLIVRTLADPLPGVLPLALATTADRAWERAGRAALGELWRDAARPARGAVANDAPAVAFTDAGEWLACLLDDLAAQRLRWWWRTPGAAAPATSTPSAAALTHRRSLPAAFAWLADRQRALAVASRIGAEEAQVLAELLAADAGLPNLSAVPASQATPGATLARARHFPAPPGAAPQAADGKRGDSAPATRFARSVLRLAERSGVDLSPLAPPQRLLVALAIGLQRWPRALREAAAGVARAVAEQAAPTAAGSLAAPGPSPHDAALERAESPSQRPAQSPPAPTAAVSTERRGRAAGQRSLPRRHADQHVEQRANQRGDRAASTLGTAAAGGEPRPVPTALAASALARDPAPALPRPADRRVAARSVAGRDGADTAAASAGANPARPTLEAPNTAPGAHFLWPDDGVPSALAGAGLLINLMLHLDLPDAFEPRFGLARRLGPWATLAALAAAWLDEPTPHDPLWTALDALAGPAPELDAPVPAFRWPPGWLARCGLAKTPRRRAALPAACAARVGQALTPLFAHLLPVLTRRLQRALGDQTPAELLRRPGRIYLTSTHLDLVLPLAAISLAARRAGLDRDPGWLPGWGRVVLFHFE